MKKYIIYFFFIYNITIVNAQVFTHDVDSFRNVIQDGFDLNSPIEIQDTFLFLKQGFYSMVNYDNTSTFNDIFLCYEPGYRDLIDPKFSEYRFTALTMKRDIRILFLYYIDQYILRSRNNNNWVDKFSEISMIDIKTKKPFEMMGEKGFENVLFLYQKLIIALEKKEFKQKVIQNRELSMLQFLGYDWVIKNVED